MKKSKREEYLKMPEPSIMTDETREKFSQIMDNAAKRPRRRNLKLFTFGFGCICLLICLILPTIALVYSHTRLNEDPTIPLIYYADDEANKEYLSSQEAKDLISPNYSKYEFLFNTDEYTFSNAIAYYAKDNNELLAIYVNVNEIAIPMTNIEFYLKISERFMLSAHNSYLEDAQHISTSTYDLYKKVITDVNNNSTMYGFTEYSDYKFYLTLNFEHEVLFNKFL